MNGKSLMEKKFDVNFGTAKIAIIYLLIGSLWILFSDQAAAVLATDRVMLTRISTIKGWGYVIVTAGLLYWLIRRYTNALYESGRHYRTLIEQASDGIFLANSDQHFIEVNSAGCSLLGYTREEILQLRMCDVTKLSPETPLRLEELRNGKTFLSEREMIRKDGRLVSVEISARQLPDGCFQGIVRDITERRQVEESLRESQELFSLFMRHSPIYIYIKAVTPTESRVLQASDNYQDMIGISGRDMVGKTMAELFPAEFAAKITADDWTVITNNEVLKLDEDLNGRNYTSIKFPIVQGDKTLLAGYTIDITERKHAEQVLATSEAELRALFASMRDLAMVIDREGVYCKIAPTNLDLLVASPDELLGKNLRDVFPAEQAETFIVVIQQVLEKQQAAHIEYQLVVNGRPLWFDTSVSSMTADTTLWVVRDITERKQAEDELRRAKNALEIAHSELQQSLAHEQVLARTDGLTGLCNRRYFFELAIREFNAALRYQRPLTIIIFDADDLKRVNDTFGHEAGDKMLLMITQVAAAQVRTVDVLARYGGDEFIILLPQTNAQQAFVIAERIRENVMAARVETDNETLTATISIGVAETIHGSRDESVETVIHRADEALYTAKQGGHNRTVIIDPDIKLNLPMD